MFEYLKYFTINRMSTAIAARCYIKRYITQMGMPFWCF